MFIDLLVTDYRTFFQLIPIVVTRAVHVFKEI